MIKQENVRNAPTTCFSIIPATNAKIVPSKSTIMKCLGDVWDAIFMRGSSSTKLTISVSYAQMANFTLYKTKLVFSVLINSTLIEK